MRNEAAHEAKREGARKIAKRLLKMEKLSHEEIADGTGLPLEEVNFDSLTLLDIYVSEWISETRRNVIRDLLQAEAPEKVIKSIIRPEIEEGQVLQKKKMWMEMRGKEAIEE